MHISSRFDKESLRETFCMYIQICDFNQLVAKNGSGYMTTFSFRQEKEICQYYAKM